MCIHHTPNVIVNYIYIIGWGIFQVLGVSLISCHPHLSPYLLPHELSPIPPTT